MKPGAALFVLVATACGASPAGPAASPRTAQEWVSRCAARIRDAQHAAALEQGDIKTNAAPWNPSVRFEARVDGGYYEAAAGHGRDACLDFDSDDPAWTNLRWSNGANAKNVALARIRRVEGDEAWLEADRVPRATLEPFRAAFEQAIDGCLRDARTVPLGQVPPSVTCVDKMDRCPDAPDASGDDGCPPAK